MRITSGMYYRNLYGNENSKLSNQLFDVNKQIASGLKIQYASDDVTVFTETMRLDNELTTLGQVKESANSGLKVSDQTDATLNDFNDTLTRFNTLLVQAANDTNDDVSRDAIAQELRGLEGHLKNLANTSIDGKYLFSGSVTDVKPINDDGTYNGNNVELNAFIGSNNQQQYNVSGADLFLGEESSVNREITTNVVNKNIFDGSDLFASSSLRDLMGDKNGISPNTNYFYVRGTKSDGSAFKEKFSYSDTDTIDNLLNDIGKAYGNTATSDVVNVSMNTKGEIVVEDKLKGSSKLDFHMVGAIDYTDGTGGLADVNDIDDLQTNGGETTYPPAGELYIKEFIKSDLTSANGAATIEGLIYDRTEFSKDGSLVTSNASQILKNGNGFATSSTRLSEVADTTKGTLDTTDDTLSGTTFNFDGVDVNGNTYNATINLDNAGSTFTVGGTTYDIYDMSNPRAAVPADEMSYQQLMDVMNMVVTDTLPTGGSATDYDDAIASSSYKGTTSLTYDGKLQFEDANSGTSQATIALYDATSDDFTMNVDSDGDGTNDSYTSSVMTFNTNNTLTIRDPKTDFFKEINEMIIAVEDGKTYPDATTGSSRNIGIENALAKMEDLQNHTNRIHASVGANSNSLNRSIERTATLEIATQSLRSSVIDTDLAEASLTLTKLNTNYQAMLSTVGKISQLSLVNYL